MRHRPEYINRSAPYVRPALYAPPTAPPARHARFAGRNPLRRSLAYGVGALIAAAALLGMFAYGVTVIRSAPGVSQHESTWVTPYTYGPPPTTQPVAGR